jgi:hypothetical protein
VVLDGGHGRHCCCTGFTGNGMILCHARCSLMALCVGLVLLALDGTPAAEALLKNFADMVVMVLCCLQALPKAWLQCAASMLVATRTKHCLVVLPWTMSGTFT